MNASQLLLDVFNIFSIFISGSITLQTHVGILGSSISLSNLHLTLLPFHLLVFYWNWKKRKECILRLIYVQSSFSIDYLPVLKIYENHIMYYESRVFQLTLWLDTSNFKILWMTLWTFDATNLSLFFNLMDLVVLEACWVSYL